jgi:Uri superfamily endonuclease
VNRHPSVVALYVTEYCMCFEAVNRHVSHILWVQGSHSPLLAVGLSPRARVRQRVSRHMSINEKKERAHSDDFGKDISLIPIILTQSASSSKKEKRKSTSRERKTEAK